MIFRNLFGRKTGEDDWDDWDDEDLDSSPAADDSEDSQVLREMALRARAYADFNRRKLFTILSKLNSLDQEILQILPALVHLNLEGLPGYIKDKDLVSPGIANYRVDEETQRLLKAHLHEADITPYTVRQQGGKQGAIYSLASMGSLATIAQTAKSDFDIWVCVKKGEFSEEALQALADKLAAIEEWAEKLNHFECHFFITDIDEARANNFGTSDSESAGSALGKLLKEEFFRTHTVLAGFPPLWTVMPSNVTEEEYKKLAKAARGNYKVNTDNYIDLGCAQRITMEEAFGAALWQLNKALGSPFKSAMKMGLIEDYMDPESDSVLLCDRLKETITGIGLKPMERGDVDSLGPDSLLDRHPDRILLDGYLLMFNRILEYYRRKGREDLQDILRKCFYLKAGETVTGHDDPNREKNSKKDMLAQLIEEWGWSNEEVLDLNSFKEWPFEKSVTLGKEVNSFIIESYKRLSQSGATASIQINPTDLTVLGRKLFTFYSRKENKIDFLPKSFEDSLKLSEITFSYTHSPKGPGLWKVFRGVVSANDIKKDAGGSQLLRQTRNLAGLLMWLVMNGIWDRDTQVNLISTDSPLSTAHLRDLLEAIDDFFPHIDVAHLSNQDLLKEAIPKRIFVILNLSDSKMSKSINSIDLLYDSTWGEIYNDRPSGQVNQRTAIQFCLEHLSRIQGYKRENFRLYIPSGKTGVSNRQVFLDFEQMVLEIADFFFSTPLPEDTIRTFVFQSDRGVSSFTWTGSGLESTHHTTFDEFFLKREQGEFRRVELKVAASPTKLVSQQAMSNLLRSDVVQVFVHDDGIKGRVYISDEMGGTMFVALPPKGFPIYGSRLAVFLGNVVKKLETEPARVKGNMKPPEVVFYSLHPTGPNHDRFKVSDITEQLMGGSRVRPEVQRVLEEKTPDGKQAIIFDTGDSRFSSADHGSDVFRVVASHIFSRRENKSKAPICVAELDLPRAFRQKNCPLGAKTVHYLTYRRLVEGKLNQALKALE